MVRRLTPRGHDDVALIRHGLLVAILSRDAVGVMADC
jgi:hypothetical protein